MGIHQAGDQARGIFRELGWPEPDRPATWTVATQRTLAEPGFAEQLAQPEPMTRSVASPSCDAGGDNGQRRVFHVLVVNVRLKLEFSCFNSLNFLSIRFAFMFYFRASSRRRVSTALDTRKTERQGLKCSTALKFRDQAHQHLSTFSPSLAAPAGSR